MNLTLPEALAILLGGLLGSAHCLGMCGGFALSLGLVGRSWKLNLGRQLLYGLGRVFTYTVGGVLAGYAGSRLAAWLPDVTLAQAALSLMAGALLIVAGLSALGLFARGSSSSAGCVSGGMFGALLRATRLRSVFLGGVINGLLPCGLVYAYLALAGSSRQPVAGGAVMLLFGLGTLPALALLGVGVGGLSLGFRKKLLATAACCVIATGGVSIWRGCAFLQTTDGEACPFCARR